MTDQLSIRGEGILMPICVHADNLAEAAHKAIIACHDSGARAETPKHKKGMTLGYDAPIIVGVRNADSEPKVYFPAMHDSPLGTINYILEVTHAIHDHWKKTPEEPHFWGYTYNERFVDQLPFIFQRIKSDWEEKLKKEGEARISGRDYMFDIWRAGEDIILEQPDAPCFQRGGLRFLFNDKGEIVLNYLTAWRSRDELKAWNENDTGQVGCEEVPGLMRLFRDKVSNMLGVPIKMGSYIDYSDSLHLYGLYIDRDGLEEKIANMKKEGWEGRSMPLKDWILMNDHNLSISGLKSLIAAQLDAEKKGHGKQQPYSGLSALGYDIENFQYPQEWDSWPKSWDAKPDVEKLARVIDIEKIKKSERNRVVDEILQNGFSSLDEVASKIASFKK